MGSPAVGQDVEAGSAARRPSRWRPPGGGRRTSSAGPAPLGGSDPVERVDLKQLVDHLPAGVTDLGCLAAAPHRRPRPAAVPWSGHHGRRVTPHRRAVRTRTPRRRSAPPRGARSHAAPAPAPAGRRARSASRGCAATPPPPPVQPRARTGALCRGRETGQGPAPARQRRPARRAGPAAGRCCPSGRPSASGAGPALLPCRGRRAARRGQARVLASRAVSRSERTGFVAMVTSRLFAAAETPSCSQVVRDGEAFGRRTPHLAGVRAGRRCHRHPLRGWGRHCGGRGVRARCWRSGRPGRAGAGRCAGRRRASAAGPSAPPSPASPHPTSGRAAHRGRAAGAARRRPGPGRASPPLASSASSLGAAQRTASAAAVCAAAPAPAAQGLADRPGQVRLVRPVAAS